MKQYERIGLVNIPMGHPDGGQLKYDKLLEVIGKTNSQVADLRIKTINVGNLELSRILACAGWKRFTHLKDVLISSMLHPLPPLDQAFEINSRRPECTRFAYNGSRGTATGTIINRVQGLQSFIVSLECPNDLDSVQLPPATLIAKQLLGLGGPGCVFDIRQAGADDRRNRMPPLIKSIRNQIQWGIEREKNPDPVDWSTRRDTSSP